MASSLAVLIASLLLLQNDVDAQLYEWSCSPLNANTNHYTLPDLGYGDDEDVQSIGQDLAGSDRNSIEINPLPSTLNCSGTVSAVEYCYGSRVSDTITYGTNYGIFTLLTLQQNGLTFEITDMIDVHSTPSREKCTDRLFGLLMVRYCCDTMVLDQVNQFTLPASNLAFGILPVNLLRYRSDRFPDLLVEQYSVPLSEVGTPAVGNTFTLSDTNRRTDVALALFQFVIGITPGANHSTTTTTHTTPITSTSPAPGTSVTTSTEATIPPTTMGVTVESGMNSATMETTVGGDRVNGKSTSDLGLAIGASLAAVLVVILLVIFPQCVPLVLYKCTQAKAQSNSVITAQPNQVYGITKANTEEVFYETIDTAGHDKNKDQFETEANCAYGVNSDVAVVVYPNNAYGVHVKGQDEDPYYI